MEETPKPLRQIQTIPECLLCPFHSKTIDSICPYSFDPLCPDCRGADGTAGRKSLSSIAATVFAEGATVELIQKVVHVAKESIPRLEKGLKARLRAFESMSRSLEGVSSFLDGAEEKFESDLEEVDRTIDFLNATIARSHSQGLKATLNRAKALFDFEDELRSEYTMLFEQREKMKDDLRNLEYDIKMLRSQLRRSRVVAGISPFADVSGCEHLLSLCNELGSTLIVATHPRHFSAFRSAGTLPFVRAALKNPLREIGAVQISEPAPVPIVCGEISSIAAAVSEMGVFAFSGSLTDDRLFLTDLRNPQGTVFIAGCGGPLLLAFHNKRIFVAKKRSTTLLRAKVSDVLRDPRIGVFSKHEIPRVETTIACTDLAQWTGTILYRGPNSRLVELDLRTLECRVSDSAITTCVPSSTGIRPEGLRALVYERGGLLTATDPSGAREQVQSRAMSWVTTFFPSTSAPADVRKGAWVDTAGGFYHGRSCTQLTTPLMPENIQTFVRVWCDVFLCFDKQAEAWVAVRVIVP